MDKKQKIYLDYLTLLGYLSISENDTEKRITLKACLTHLYKTALSINKEETDHD